MTDQEYKQIDNLAKMLIKAPTHSDLNDDFNQGISYAGDQLRTLIQEMHTPRQVACLLKGKESV